MTDEEFEKVFYSTLDPTIKLQHPRTGEPMPIPAGTTLLINVLQKDHEQFGEAIRLIKLFCEKTLEIHCADHRNKD